MAGKRLEALDQYGEWFKFVLERKHIHTEELIRLCQKQFSKDSNPTWYSRIIKIRRNVADIDTVDLVTKRRTMSAAEREKEFLKFIRLPDFTPSRKMLSKKIDPDKIICVSDPHVPFHTMKLFDYIYLNHGDAGHLHINGDFGDFFSKSHFRKTKDVPFSDELRECFLIMDWASARFERVTISLGNHDTRANKILADKLTTDMLWMTESDIIKYMSRFFDNVEVVGTRIPGKDDEINWIWQKGDIIFTHVERSLEQSSRILDIISSQIYKWKGIYRFKPYRVIVQGHNHRALKTTVGEETQFLVPMAGNLLEAGFDYTFGPRFQGTPSIAGYTLLYQHNGRTDINRSAIEVWEGQEA